MKHVETTISGDGLRLRYADDPDPARAAEWIDLRIKKADLKHGSGTPMAALENQYLVEVQVAALSHALQLIQAEIRRLKDIARATT